MTKTDKTFLATCRPAGGKIRVVQAKQEHGWFAFDYTDPTAKLKEIIEAFGDRATIEQDFHDGNEAWSSG